jgi:VWFA-related protein
MTKGKWATALLLACHLASTPQARSAQDAQGQPTFRSSVDLVPVDVNIIDKTGRPVTALEAGDFVLTIDGKVRRIATAQYVAAGEPRAAAPTYYSSNMAAAGGRLIMLVVDQGAISAGRGKLALDAASRFVSRLGPADRVGLVSIPGSGPRVDFTSNHAVVQALLPKLIGQATTPGAFHVGLAEAVGVQRGDAIALRQVLDRECSGMREPTEIQDCTQRLTVEANVVYQTARDRTRNSLIALRSLIERLANTPSPKTIVLLSEGIVLDPDSAELSWLGPAAARGQVVLYALHLDAPPSDAEPSRISPTRGQDMAVGEEGLATMAGLARGSVFRVASTADTAFSRLALEISGYYLLSFAPEPEDRDGKLHKIKIGVPGRNGIEIRSRTQFTVEAARAGTSESLLADALRAPLLATDIGLKVSTYTLRDAATGKLRVIVAADIDRSVTSAGRLALAYTLLDSAGRVVNSQLEPEVKAPERGPMRTQTYVASVLAEAPGVHTLKLAVVDAAGKRGSVEHTFRAQLTPVGQLKATDLLIAENTGSIGAGGLSPAVAGDFTSGTLHAYLELYAEAEDPLTKASVVFEVAAGDDGRAIESGLGQIQSPAADAPGRRTVEGAVPIGLLPPGDYVARAVVSLDGRKAATLTRPFRVSSPPTAASADGTEARPNNVPRPAIPFTSRIEAFERSAVLAPEIVGFFLDRMKVGAGGAASAIADAKAGRFEAAAEALASPQNVKTDTDRLLPVFLNGLALYSRGQLEAAAGQFRESLRIDSEFFPAAFYLGSCYAAGGRDREAAGAWQTSLVAEGDAPFVYTVLGDALLRLRDADKAVDILKEAAGSWPESDEVRLRLGTAYAMAGSGADALNTLEPYLARHPDDHERLFVALRVLYEARAARRQIRSGEEDRALFLKYADAYDAASGPQRAIVDQWKKFMSR